MKKINCWEFKQCGREPGGKRVDELGVCPVAVEASVDGMKSGKNGGRVCWVVKNLLELSMEDNSSYEKCNECGFFKLVMEEEELTCAEETV